MNAKINILGKGSNRELDTCHVDMQLIHREAITYSPIDYSIVQGERLFGEQLILFNQGKSRLDPRDPEQLKRAKHVITEERPKSEATDIALYVPGKELAYHEEGIILVVGHILATAKRLYNEGKITHLIRWGGNWDGDNEIVTDQNFNDLVHLELYKPEKKS